MQRRTQAERRAATRKGLVDAAGELLIEHGWAHATSVAVCARAGLTRGAFVHHFDGLPDLFAAVVQDFNGEIVTAVESRGEPVSIAEIVQRAWAHMRQRRFKILLEAWLAGSNDPDLGRMLQPVVETFAKLFGPDRWPELLADDDSRAFYLMARESLLGLAWGRAVNGGSELPHEAAVLDHLITAAQTHDARLGR